MPKHSFAQDRKKRRMMATIEGSRKEEFRGGVIEPETSLSGEEAGGNATKGKKKKDISGKGLGDNGGKNINQGRYNTLVRGLK